MKKTSNNSLEKLLRDVPIKTLVITCMDFQGLFARVNNAQISVTSVLGGDLERCCPDTLQMIAKQVHYGGIKQLIVLSHMSSKVHQHLLMDFDKKARWADLADKLREQRLILHADGVSVMDNKKFTLRYIRSQHDFLENYFQVYCNSHTLKFPRLRCIIADSGLCYTELIKIEISGFKN